MRDFWKFYVYLERHNSYQYRRELEDIYDLPKTKYTLNELWVEHVVKHLRAVEFELGLPIPVEPTFWKRIINWIKTLL
jgi:hypothetical protein